MSGPESASTSYWTEPLLDPASEDENEASIDEEADDPPPAVPTPAEQVPVWRGSWKRRQEAQQAQVDRDALAAKSKPKRASRRTGAPVQPPIPDMRFEEGVLASIRQYLHLAPGTEGDQTVQEGKRKGEVTPWSELFSRPVRVDWTGVLYVLVRDQVSPRTSLRTASILIESSRFCCNF